MILPILYRRIVVFAIDSKKNRFTFFKMNCLVFSTPPLNLKKGQLYKVNEIIPNVHTHLLLSAIILLVIVTFAKKEFCAKMSTSQGKYLIPLAKTSLSHTKVMNKGL
jgi:hypothetical protein